jgi:multidrug efflux pump subunit AcrA (membrane-fusion protein)
MSLFDLAALYALGGVVSAGVVWRLTGALGSAALALVAWPLWLPLAFGATRERSEPAPATKAAPPVASRIEVVLAEARAAAAGTDFEAMLNEAAAARIVSEVQRASERLAGMAELLARPGYNAAEARARLDALEGATEGTQRTARLHLESVERLARMHREQEAALVELEQVITALRSQLEVARYAGSMNEGFDAIVGDLWSRVEGLGEAYEPLEPSEPMPPTGDFQQPARVDGGGGGQGSQLSKSS